MKPKKDNSGPVSIQLPNKDLCTAAQVNTLLSVANVSLSALGHFLHTIEETPGAENRLAGEARLAAESTFIKTCDRLQNILEDQSRWSNEFYNRLERDYTELHAKQMQFVETQIATTAELVSPHYVYKPQIARILGQNAWIAFLGSADDLENAISGIGPTPQQALEAFDCMFASTPISPELRAWLEQREKDLENNAPLAQFPTNKNEQPEQLDTERPESDEQHEGPGDDLRGNRGNPGTDSGLGSGPMA